MGRPGLSRHPKFLRLALELGNEPLARGALELLWEVAYEAGDPRIGDPANIEAAARWRGEKGILFAALRDAGGTGRAGFIEDRDGEWVVHDLWDHAPDYVRKRAAREDERRAKGRSMAAARTTVTGHDPVTDRALTPPRSPARAPSPAPEKLAGPAPADPPATAEALALVPTEPGEKPPRKRSEGQQFWDWYQDGRTKNTGLVREAEANPAALNVWLKRAVSEVTLQRLYVAAAKFVRAPKDDYWRSRGFPFLGFMTDSVWRQYVPPEERSG